MAQESHLTYGGPYGRRLYVNVVDETATAQPDRTWIYTPRTSDARDGWKPLTWRQHANAVNRTAAWLVEHLGKPQHKTFPSVAYVGPNDARYLVLFAAGVKAGYQIMFPSPRNNTESQVSLLQVTKCQKLLHGAEYAKRIRPWVQDSGVEALEMLSLEAMFDESPVPVVPYTETFESAEFDPVIIMHTSGSTGIPKPIYCNQGLFSTMDNYHNSLQLDGSTFVIEAMASFSNLSYCPLPLFHAFGLYCCINICGFWGKPLALGAGDRPLTAENVVAECEAAECDALILPPSIVEDISRLEGGLEKLKKLSYVCCGGGGISTEVGNDLIAQGVKLNSVISSTEYNIYPVYWQTNYKYWDFFIFDNEQFGCKYEPVGDNIFEQTIIRHEPRQPIFYTFPDKTEYKTGDLFEAHPTLPNHWRSQGRIDNIIVFSNGEKLNPVSIEAAVTQHPEVRQALVVGHGQFQAGMILEPTHWPLDDAQRVEFIDNVWPVIEKANAATVEHGRIARHLVTISDPYKPFLFSPKGSFRRGAALKLYKDEIADLFAAEEVIVPVELDAQTLQTLTAGIRSLFAAVVGEIDDDEDFFLRGVDSLQTIHASKRISVGLKAVGVDEQIALVAPRDIYANSTITQLSSFLFNRLQGNVGDGVSSIDATIQGMIDKYSSGLGTSKPPPKSTAKTVLLTGSTGSLGSYILHFLIHMPEVDRIVCLNRSEDGGRSKQLAANEERGLSTSFHKVQFLHADLSQPGLGLEEGELNALEHSVDSIIHNAWSVNFNLAVQSFEGQIRGVRHLIDLAQRATVRATITFISTIGTVDGWSHSSPIPEANLTDPGLAVMGYGQSKLVSSIIVDRAAKLAGVPAAVVRLGQVAGPTTQQGSWNSQDWLPTIIESSVKIGSLPNSLGSLMVDWVPVDKAARTILDMTDFTTEATVKGERFTDGAKLFNLVNPETTTWESISPAIVSFYEHMGKKLQLIGFEEWVKAVESAPASLNLPAVKLLDTFKAMAASIGSKNGHAAGFATDRARAASKTLADLEAITPELVSLWCQQWNFAM